MPNKLRVISDTNCELCITYKESLVWSKLLQKWICWDCIDEIRVHLIELENKLYKFKLLEEKRKNVSKKGKRETSNKID